METKTETETEQRNYIKEIYRRISKINALSDTERLKKNLVLKDRADLNNMKRCYSDIKGFLEKNSTRKIKIGYLYMSAKKLGEKLKEHEKIMRFLVT